MKRLPTWSAEGCLAIVLLFTVVFGGLQNNSSGIGVPRAHAHLAEAYRNRGQFREAILEYQVMAEEGGEGPITSSLYPTTFKREAWNGIAEIWETEAYRNHALYRPAFNLLGAVLVEDPEHPKANLNMAVMAMRLDAYPEAERFLRNDREKDVPEWMFDMAECLNGLHRCAEAREFYAKAARWNTPGRPQFPDKSVMCSTI